MPDSNLLERDATLLLVVDVQERINAVMESQAHVPRIKALIEGAKVLGLPVIVTEQYPKGLGHTLDEIARLAPGEPFQKSTFSCVRQPGFMELLLQHEPRNIILCGIEAHVCILQTAIDLVARGFKVHIPYDAVNSRRRRDYLWGLHRMHHAGVVVTATESALFEMLESCGTDEFKQIAKIIKPIPVSD